MSVAAGNEERAKFLLWLAECQRSNSIAQPRDFRIEPEWLRIEKLRPQAEYWRSAGFDLFYEPRSLAVSPHGGQVAVGTKAGEVCLAVWDAEEQTWKDRRVTKEAIRDGRNPVERKSSPSAVRGLIILDEHTLVAAWGLSSFSIVTFLPALAEPDVIVLEPGDDPTVSGKRIGAQRFSRLVHLYAPQGPIPDSGDLVLGIPRGGKLHVLGRERGEYVRRRAVPEDLFEKWDRQMGRLVDGVWQHGVLWLLTSEGWLVRYTVGESRTRGLVQLATDRIEPPRQHALFRRLDACEAGLAILAAESVAFQWLHSTEKAHPDLEAGPVHWFHVPGAIDCAACVAYPLATTAREICNSKFDWRNPVWSVVSTAEPGLRWISWTNPRLPSHPEKPARETRWARAAPANFAVSGGGSILHVGFGRPGSDPGTPPFLACGTRDHKLLIASVLDRWACDDEVDQQMTLSIAGASSSMETNAKRGIQWWYLQRRIQSDFVTLEGSLSDEERGSDYPNTLLGCTDHNNLRFIASKLVEWCNLAVERERKACGDDPQEFAKRLERLNSVLTLWILRLLLRSKQLGADVDREIALLLVEKLQLASGKTAQSEDRLLSLADFLRKWIIHGGTYGEKTSGIHKVYEWNEECGRNMDALVYLTRLMRQRVDQHWQAAPPVGPGTPTVWSLVTGVAGEFSIVSLADGGLCAVSGDGELARWQIDDEDRLSQRELRLRENGLRLERSEAKLFEERYRHGPYARSLWLTQVGGPPAGQDGDRDYLLVFCLKGWRREDRGPTGREPRIYGLRLRAQSEGSGDKRRVRALSIELIESKVVCNELYALCTIESAENRFVLAAGTSLSWKISGNEKPETWRPQPFVELTIQLRPDSIDLHVLPVKIERFVESERSVLRRESVPPETAYNPAWSIVRSLNPRTQGPDEVWLWAGFQDGNIRGYRRENDAEGNPFWQERSARAGESRPVRRGLKTTGAVWRLLEFESRGGERMLAYGTGDGVVGAVSLRDLLDTEAGDPVSFLVHTREGAPICGLLHYEDRESGSSHPFLLSVTQSGMVCVFSLDYIRWSGTSQAEESQRRGYRFYAPGFRVDRFRLPRTLRAIAWIDPGKDGRRVPRFVFGSVDGKVYECSLDFPHYSERRRRLTSVLEKLSRTTEIGRKVQLVVPQIGEQAEQLLTDREKGATLHLWLRVLTTGESLLRYSLWDELRQAGEEIWNEPEGIEDEQIEKNFSHFKETIERLATETYQLVPFSKEPAKILWLEGGKIASHIALQALRKRGAPLEPNSQAARKLTHYLELNILFSDLCNRWIGAAQSTELTVLIHSFAALFDWTAVILIATEQQPETEAEGIRLFLVYNLIQRRLNFPDTVVPLETLRTINAAILRAILNNRKGTIEHRDFQILTKKMEGRQEHSSHGFYDLMTMVGDLWERQSPALSLSDPLVSEIIRFFSLSLLLLPDCALLTGQVVSESRLTEGGTKLAKLILEQANRIRKELLSLEGKERRKEPLDRGLKLFRAYFGEGVNFTIAEAEGPIPPPPPKLDEDNEGWSWHYLLSEAEKWKRRELTDELSDQNMMIELHRVLRAAAWISDLDRSGQFDIAKLRAKEAPLDHFTEPVHWLIEERPCQFFKHSQLYLNRLLDVRQAVRRTAGLQPGPSEQGKSIRNALATCNNELDRLDGEYLFRPQRDHYRQIIQRWRDQLVNRAGEAVQVVEILDQFNRHVYRTSADNLMDNIVDLSMQTAPISSTEWLSTAHNGSLRRLIHERLQGFPLVQQVFEVGERLVDSTYLAGALLAVARNFLGKPGELGLLPSTHNVTPDEIEKSIKEAARRKGLPVEKRVWAEPSDPNARKAPGSRAIWDLIAQEFATNIAKYSQSDPSGREKPSRIVLQYAVQEDETGSLCFLISANVAYRWTLRKEDRDRLEAMAVASAVNDMEKQFEQFLGARERGHQDERGAGMGLYMIDKIAELSGMKASLLLFNPEDDLKRRSVKYTPHQKWEAPLCLCISLQTGNGHG